MAAFGAGGNLVLDTTVFLEYLPGDKQWMVTTLAGEALSAIDHTRVDTK